MLRSSDSVRDDIESVSHTRAVVMDSLPDQFMEEVEEVVSTANDDINGNEEDVRTTLLDILIYSKCYLNLLEVLQHWPLLLYFYIKINVLIRQNK